MCLRRTHADLLSISNLASSANGNSEKHSGRFSQRTPFYMHPLYTTSLSSSPTSNKTIISESPEVSRTRQKSIQKVLTPNVHQSKMIVAESTAQPLTPTAGRGQATGQRYTAARKLPPAEQAPSRQPVHSCGRRWQQSAWSWVACPDPCVSSRIFSQQLTVSPREHRLPPFLPAGKNGRAPRTAPQRVGRHRSRERVISVLFPKETMWISPRD